MSRPISAAYLERKLRAITGVAGSNPLPDLEALAGLLTLESDRPEWLLAGGELYGWGREIQAAVAAQFSWVALVNPAGSGVLAVVEALQSILTISTSVELFVNYDIVTSPLPGSLGGGTGRPRDTRAIGQNLACSTEFGASAAAVGDGPGWVVNAGIAAHYAGGPWVLGPGSALIARTVALNTAAACVWHWRERPLEGRVELR